MKRLIVGSIVGALLVAACTSGQVSSPEATTDTTTTTTTSAGQEPKFLRTRMLTPFDACDDLLDWIVPQALELVGPYGLAYGGIPYGEVMFAADVAGGVPRAAAEEDAGTSGAAFTGTNVQELGIDEPDIVKTDGRRLIAVVGDTLHIVVVDGDDVSRAGSIRLDFWTQSIFLVGDRVLAASNSWGNPVPLIEPGISREEDIYWPQQQQPIVTIAEIDISDVDDPELTSTLRIDGAFVSARLVHDRVRLVVSSAPTGFQWAYPEGGGLRAERAAEEKNIELIEDSTIENWLPYFILTDHTGVDRVVDEGVLVDCNRVHRPEDFSGLNLLSLITLDDDDLAAADTTSVFADGQIVYSSGEATYVATTRWFDPVLLEREGLPDEAATMIHKFALTEQAAGYRASGAVGGYMLSQWSMSEWDGHLRVATTSSPEWWGGEDSESFVTVLAERDGELVETGFVSGLGKGERIYAVRMMQDRGYVVTFRQVDPLYVLDLSDHSDPRVEGELKIPGYSAYLHPADGGYLIGVGQDADNEGRVEGTQVSLFDVADPRDPDRVDRLTIENGHSEVEWDHHAFLHHAESGLTVVPYQQWCCENGKDAPMVGAIVMKIADGRIRDLGTISHVRNGDEWGPQIRRALLIGDVLVTVSESGIMLSDPESLDTLDRLAW
jgi:uncharacterized secreted protein with C-terminal beta-propeller domain